jgi:hypothetical protein
MRRTRQENGKPKAIGALGAPSGVREMLPLPPLGEDPYVAFRRRLAPRNGFLPPLRGRIKVGVQQAKVSRRQHPTPIPGSSPGQALAFPLKGGRDWTVKRPALRGDSSTPPGLALPNDVYVYTII